MEVALNRLALLPPMLGIVVCVACTGHSNGDVFSENFSKNVLGATRVIIRGYDNHVLPAFLLYQLLQRLGFFPGVVGILRKWKDVFPRNTPLNQIMDHQLRDSSIWAQTYSAGHHQRREFLPKYLGGACRAVRIKIVVA